MIENTKTYKGKTESASKQSASASEMPQQKTTEGIEADSNATHLPKMSRREWFSALRPALGDGLVKLIRTSNNLQREINEELHEQIRASTLPKKQDSK
ncbi:MAG: hypothetical protein M9962_01470 [Oligoflexia bacterium]|nr:hypothetical protein [Oligoflexia bacterium]